MHADLGVFSKGMNLAKIQYGDSGNMGHNFIPTCTATHLSHTSVSFCKNIYFFPVIGLLSLQYSCKGRILIIAQHYCLQ